MESGLSRLESVSEEEFAGERAAAELVVRLRVVDPEVVGELRRHKGEGDRERYALAALRLGVLSLKTAGGSVDAQMIRDAGDRLIANIREVLTTRASEVSNQMTGTLARYFDPATGVVPQRIDSLVKRDGELERVLRGHLGAEDSALARVLTAHLGEESPIFKMLSPTEANGLLAQLSETVEHALRDQREVVLREFSLDSKESALSRLTSELRERQGEMQNDVKGQVESVVREFTLDRPDSALSRLVARVDAAHKTIVDQFSIDAEGSAINKLTGVLQETSDQIGRSLTLDDEGSALSRLRRELKGAVEDLVKRNTDFQGEVRETLAALQARRREESRATRHGTTFEADCGSLLVLEAQRVGDVCQATGNASGLIKNCKVGDHVVHLGPESMAPGACIVWEAKEDRSYDLRAALAEIETARKNRGAQVGVFVFSKKSAPEGLAAFGRYGSDLVIVWDAEDPGTDLVVKAANSVARALVVREAADSDQSKVMLRDVEVLTRAIEKQAGHLDQVKTWADTIHSNSAKISERAGKMKADLEKNVAELDTCVAALKGHGPQE